MLKLSRIAMVISFLSLLVCYWNKDNLSSSMSLAPEILREPEQGPTNTQNFPITVNKHTYLVEPQFEYNLYGMVVSYRHHNGDSRLRSWWKDHLNIVDICVVWKDAASSQYLTKIDFWSGQFTCFFQTSDQEAWNKFNFSQLSNNHLISNDETIRKQIKKINIGDQIQIKGYLSNYVHEDGRRRKTSITRTDKGNGACETVFVKEFNIIKSYSSLWEKFMYLSLLAFFISVYFFIKAPYQPPSPKNDTPFPPGK